MPLSFMQKCRALLLQRCPTCGRGRVYERGLKMNSRCPECGLIFEREEGYFMGALYISYGTATLIMALMLGVGHFVFPETDLGIVALVVIACFIPLTPMVTRYSRVVWIYFDRWAWPERAEPDAPARDLDGSPPSGTIR